ncbi:unnamed protein product [Onchocerca ochengi]|uniref:Secreted protein n=1 Tax=Onchocerca ochengi TaxID=42157 RepID=A0A182E1K8_ONCOC|nr:unnamed protein product [Onchocerca ochengi]
MTWRIFQVLNHTPRLEISKFVISVQLASPKASALSIQMSTAYRISWVFVCLALFTETNALRGALFRTGKMLWPFGEYDSDMNLFKPHRSTLEMSDAVDYNNENRDAMSNTRGVKKAFYLK